MASRESQVAKDRIITRFERAYADDATPYKKFEFHPRVRQACANNKTNVGYVQILTILDLSLIVKFMYLF